MHPDWTVTGREMAEGSDGVGSGLKMDEGGGGSYETGEWDVFRNNKRKKSRDAKSDDSDNDAYIEQM